jgi:hypothetical protein
LAQPDRFAKNSDLNTSKRPSTIALRAARMVLQKKEMLWCEIKLAASISFA